jgi:phosphatidylglycerophosphatase A
LSFHGDSDIRKTSGIEGESVSARWVDRFALRLATCGGVGRFPYAPGTAGALVAIPVSLLLEVQPLGYHILSLLALTAVAIWAADRAEVVLGRRDPSEIVVDEVVGMAVSLAWVDSSVVAVCVGFALFRFFDIVKIPPAGWAERRLSGGLAVVADDLVAGLYANVCLRGLMALTGW